MTAVCGGGSPVRSVSLCLGLLLWLAAVVVCAQKLPHVPPALRAMLDREYKGWHLAEVSQEVKAYFARERVTFSPNLLVGDFNGDGKRDYALLIEHHSRLVVLVFVNRGRSCTRHVLETLPKGDVSVYLWLFRKGEKDYDYEARKEFTYRIDAIGVMFYKKGGVSYVYERGRFHKVTTSD